MTAVNPCLLSIPCLPCKSGVCIAVKCNCVSGISLSGLDLKKAPALVGGYAASPFPRNRYLIPAIPVLSSHADLCKVIG